MPPLSILIKPASGACQYRCRYCFYTDEMNRRNVPLYGMMSEETLSKLVRRAFAYAEGSVAFCFQGGEPMLAGIGFFRKLITLEKSCGKAIEITNSIQTNGGLVNDEWAEFFAENRFLVGLSLDGTREVHDSYRIDSSGNGTYAAVTRAAELLEKHGVQFNVLCVVNKEVCAEPAKTYEALREYGFVQFIPCLPPLESGRESFAPTSEAFGNFLCVTWDLYEHDLRSGRYVSVRQFDNYLQMIMGAEPESCGMKGRCSCVLTVEADGSAYPCDFYATDEWKLGNITTDGIAKLTGSENSRRFIEASWKTADVCAECPYYRICRGGCRREREPLEMNGTNIYCEGYRAFFDAKYDRMKMLAEYIRKKR